MDPTATPHEHALRRLTGGIVLCRLHHHTTTHKPICALHTADALWRRRRRTSKREGVRQLMERRLDESSHESRGTESPVLRSHNRSRVQVTEATCDRCPYHSLSYLFMQLATLRRQVRLGDPVD